MWVLILIVGFMNGWDSGPLGNIRTETIEGFNKDSCIVASNIARKQKGIINSFCVEVKK